MTSVLTSGKIPMMLSRKELLQIMEDRYREDPDLNDHSLAVKAKVPYSNVVDFRRGKTQMFKPERLHKILNALGVTSGSQRVPIIGEVGAGGEVYPIDDLPLMKSGVHEDARDYMNCEFVDAPPGTYPDGIVAVRVKGSSMLPFMPAGTVVYYEQRVEGACHEFLNKLCVVQIKDGPAMLKILEIGTEFARYNLRSYNLELIHNVELAWCAKVIFIKPV